MTTTLNDFDPSRLTFSRAYDAAFATKLYFINHKNKHLKLETPVMLAPFGLSQFSDKTDLSLKLEKDETNDAPVFSQKHCEIWSTMQEATCALI